MSFPPCLDTPGIPRQIVVPMSLFRDRNIRIPPSPVDVSFTHEELASLGVGGMSSVEREQWLLTIVREHSDGE